MNIFFHTIYSNTFYQIENKFSQLTPLQKKVSLFVIAYFSLAALSYTLYRCYARQQKMSDEQQELDLNSDTSSPQTFKKIPKPKFIIKPKEAFAGEEKLVKIEKSLLEHQVPSFSPDLDLKTDETDTLVVKEEGLPDSFPSLDPDDSIEETNDSPTTPPLDEQLPSDAVIAPFIHQTVSNKDFLSLLRFMAEHKEWVEANLEETISILKQFGNNGSSLHPIKIVADLYEQLLEHHPELALEESLKNTAVIFDNKETYRTHLIFALKHLHVVRDILHEEIPDISQMEGGFEIHLPGKPKVLKATLKYLDKTDPWAFQKVRFFDLIQIAHQYHSPSIWRYCEANIYKMIQPFSKTPEGNKEWIETIQFYAGLKTQNVDFVINYLFAQRGPFIDKASLEIFFDSLPLDEMENAQKMEFKAFLIKRNDLFLEEVEVVRKEHEDRLEDSLVILDNIAERVTRGEEVETASYISCASVNIALKTIFKAAIARQFESDILKKQRVTNALFAIQKKEKELIRENTWRSFEWDKDEAAGIPSLAVCLLNYLTQEVPDEIKKLPCWHGESLVLAFNDTMRKARLSDTVIAYAECAVNQQIKPGFYYLFRPSSRVASSKHSIIFTMTYNPRNGVHIKAHHTRVEAVQDPSSQEWLFKDAGSRTAATTMDKYLAGKAGVLPLIQIEAPKTSKKRVDVYVKII